MSTPVITASARPRLRDETLQPDQLAGYNLYLTAGPAGVQVGVAEVSRNKFVLLEDYAASAEVPLATQLATLANEHDLLGQTGWNRVQLAVQNRSFTLLPASLFRPGHEVNYLQLHHAFDPAHEQVHSYRHSGLEMANVFALDQALTAWFAHTHPTGQLLHQTSALIEGVIHQSAASAPKQLYLSVSAQELVLVAVRGKKLEYCNIFSFSTAEDFIYYVILVMQELQLNPDQDKVIVWGDLLPDSALFTILRTYVRNVRFGTRPFDLAYSYRLNDLFEHRYFELYSLHLCE